MECNSLKNDVLFVQIYIQFSSVEKKKQSSHFEQQSDYSILSWMFAIFYGSFAIIIYS